MDAEEIARKKEKKALKKEKKRLAALASAGESEATTTATTSVATTPAAATSDNEAPATSTDADALQKKLEKKKRKEEKKANKKRKAEADGDANAASDHASTPAVTDGEASTTTPAAVNGNTGDEEKPKKKRKKDVKGAFGNKKQKTESNGVDGAEASAATATNGTSSSIPTLSQAEIDTFITESALTYEPSTSSSRYPPILSFDHLPISEGIKNGLKTFAKPTVVQSASWGVQLRPEPGCRPRDCVAIASTGSGKTLAFGVPILHQILTHSPKSKSIASLIVAPTRELAIQTQVNLAAIGDQLGLGVVCIYGGASKWEQKKLLSNKPRIVVGTPGRIIDLMNEGDLVLSDVSWLVLDEADRMLDKGFENDIRKIIEECKPSNSSVDGRVTSMFSATWPMSVRRLANDFMVDPVRITVGSDELMASATVSQKVIVLQDGREKDFTLTKTLRSEGFNSNRNGGGPGAGTGAQRDKVLVFALYKKEAARVAQYLERGGYQVACIQGDLSQDKREQALGDFKTGKVNVLVATDVAARGLDIPRVELVINYTFPLTVEDYVHRVGRTGRAGRKGKAVTFFTEMDKAHSGELQRVLKDGGHEVPEALAAFGGTIKKKAHAAYGDHFREIDPNVKAKKITFDD
ncbi:DEAD-domain-containing protein [Cystobasidium minutum MCA 4210]|uniref:DEAD-domain-containing protein n=1 Tax=Cystobasidium minutum MCA 4210 TaxID=1397322 RepID=UPI0034CE49D9|eukprot:jgi/Rhomi1/160472/estExt_Genewise1Plus.C_4_t10384